MWDRASTKRSAAAAVTAPFEPGRAAPGSYRHGEEQERQAGVETGPRNIYSLSGYTSGTHMRAAGNSRSSRIL